MDNSNNSAESNTKLITDDSSVAATDPDATYCSESRRSTVRFNFSPCSEVAESTTTTTTDDLPRETTPQSPHETKHSLPKSQLSTASSSSGSSEICRICHCEPTIDQPLIVPCFCDGSLRYVHQRCLQTWIQSSNKQSCEVCRCTFKIETKNRPFRKWRSLKMNAIERRKVLCSVIFHFIAITCVVWSLYILIVQTSKDIIGGVLEWQFYAKLAVVAIGLTGGLVFMYVQCKMYVQLFKKWKNFNKVIYVHSMPKK